MTINFIGLLLTRNNANGMTTKVSNAVVHTKICINSGSENPKDGEKYFDNKVPINANDRLLNINRLNEDDRTFSLFFSVV